MDYGETSKIKREAIKESVEPANIHPILKMRLRNIIAKNKEKIKLIDLYKKSMHQIYSSFEEIKK